MSGSMVFGVLFVVLTPIAIMAWIAVLLDEARNKKQLDEIRKEAERSNGMHNHDRF